MFDLKLFASAPAALWFACGCTGLRTDSEDRPDTPLSIHDGEWSEDDALLKGDLRIEGRCLLLVDPSGTRWLPLFAEGAAWNAGLGVIVGGATWRLGETVALGGGEAARDVVASRVAWVDPPGDECEFDQAWFAADPRQAG